MYFRSKADIGQFLFDRSFTCHNPTSFKGRIIREFALLSLCCIFFLSTMFFEKKP